MNGQVQCEGWAAEAGAGRGEQCGDSRERKGWRDKQLWSLLIALDRVPTRLRAPMRAPTLSCYKLDISPRHAQLQTQST
eukprot:6200076-Pleurochrysis_carterae.AAC.6